jgi:hypothetical protein
LIHKLIKLLETSIVGCYIWALREPGHIYEMELWDEDYFNTEVQAYTEINSSNCGYFQFGLVSGRINGEVVFYADGERFEFTGDGNDECDPASGIGWVRMKRKIFWRVNSEFI